MSLKIRDRILLAVSLLCLYAMPHFMESIVPVGVGFAMVLIGSSGPTFSGRQLMKYASYIAVSVGTYCILFQNQPWEFLFGWLPDRIQKFSGVPVSPCSILMAFSGWLLLSGRADRRKYVLATLLIQIPLSMVYQLDAVRSVFETLGKVLRYTGEHTRAEQALQFLWMLNYYLPVYLWSKRRV